MFLFSLDTPLLFPILSLLIEMLKCFPLARLFVEKLGISSILRGKSELLPRFFPSGEAETLLRKSLLFLVLIFDGCELRFENVWS